MRFDKRGEDGQILDEIGIFYKLNLFSEKKQNVTLVILKLNLHWKNKFKSERRKKVDGDLIKLIKLVYTSIKLLN